MLVTAKQFLTNTALNIAAIIADNGGTIVSMMYTPLTGYVVGGAGAAEVQLDSVEQAFPLINKLLNKGYNVGLFMENGAWILDQVSVHYSYQSAVDAAQFRGERSFYDIVHDAVVATSDA